MRPHHKLRRAESSFLGSGLFGCLFATRAASRDAEGSGARSVGHMEALALSVLALALAALALLPALAQAEPPKLVPYGFFAASPWASGAAVDQPSADVYVTSVFSQPFDPGHVDKFDSSGAQILPPSPFGSGLNSGVAVSPPDGNVYVFGETEAFVSTGTISTYDPSSGALLSSFSVPAPKNIFGFFSTLQIATDSAGNIYLPVPAEHEVRKYSAHGTLLNTFTGSGTSALNGPTGVAVDSSGNVWVADGGNNRIEAFSPAGSAISEISSEGVESIALDAHGNLLAIVKNGADPCGNLPSPCTHLVQYSPAGAQLADLGAGLIGSTEHFTLPSAVAVGESNALVYVTDNGNARVLKYGPPTPPTVINELSAEVNSSEAKLGARVNPGGLPATYRFEYGLTTEYGHATPFPEGSVGEGLTSRTVWASASGLASGTVYHYRVVATNELGTAVGDDRTFTTQTVSQASCPNEERRSGFSAILPDCRAYEIVTPPHSNSAQPDTQPIYFDGGGIEANYAADDGKRISYRAVEPMPEAGSSGYDYVATRGTDGWTSENVIPLQSYTGDRCVQPGTGGNEIWIYSADLTQGVLRVGVGESYGDDLGFGGGCGAEGLEIVSGEPLGVENLLLRDNTTGAYRLINTPPPDATPTSAHFVGASADLTHVFFTENAQLTTNALPGVENLFEWDEGVLRLVTVLPDGTPTMGSLAANLRQRPRVISVEGSHVFFTAAGSLYVRVNGEETVQLDQPQGGPGPGGGGVFEDASADGSQAFFTADASAGLTSDTVPGSGMNLYLYAGGQLHNLAPASTVGVRGVAGVSDDGSHVYFIAEGSLPGAMGEPAPAQGQNLYLWREGTLRFIVSLRDPEEDFGPACVWRYSDTSAYDRNCTRISPSGRFFLFESHNSFTGYDNVETDTGRRAPEMFLYDTASDHVDCVSCDPSGEPPVSGPRGPGSYLGAPGGAEVSTPRAGSPRLLSDGGRVFFQTREALLPRDTNGRMDVYEYEQGQIHLISSGTSRSRSWLIDASRTGDDVFFISRQNLIDQDSKAEALTIYDARVNGGFPKPAGSPPPCSTAEACRPPVLPQPSISRGPSSQTFSGAGNLTAPSRACKRKRSHHKRAACKGKHKRRKATSHKEGK